MSSRLNPYLNFNGNARDAMEFYENVFGGTLILNTFGEYGLEGDDAGRIMHGMLETEEGYTIMGADVTSEMRYQPMSGVSVSLSGDDAGTLRGYWDQLSAKGTVAVPLARQPWGDQFGMCTDQFGVSWMIDIAEPAAS
jgi:PhnB protein